MKRSRADSSSETNQSDQSTESSVDRSPMREISEPQFTFDSYAGFDYTTPFDPTFSNLFSYGENDTAISDPFDDSLYAPFEDTSFNATTDFTFNSSFLWEML